MLPFANTDYGCQHQDCMRAIPPQRPPHMPGIPVAPWRGPLLPGVSPGMWSRQEGRTRQELRIPAALAQGMRPHAGRAQTCQTCSPGMPHCTQLYSALHTAVRRCSPTAFRTILSAPSGGPRWRPPPPRPETVQNWRQNCGINAAPFVGEVWFAIPILVRQFFLIYI